MQTGMLVELHNEILLASKRELQEGRWEGGRNGGTEGGTEGRMEGRREGGSSGFNTSQF